MPDPLSHNPSELETSPGNGESEQQQRASSLKADSEGEKEGDGDTPATPNGVGRDGGHTLAPKSPNLHAAVEVSRPPTRPSSPDMLLSGFRKTSQGQLYSSAEIDDPAASDLARSQNDSFTQQLMAGALRLKSSLFKPERISFADIAHNPTLARRARAEMDNHQFKGMIEGADGPLYEGRAHDLEVARLQVALDVVESDAEEESKINSQLAQLICVRMEASRRAVERLLGILQAITAAEAAYSRSMTAVSRIKLASKYDGPTLRMALTRFSDVPWLLGETHASIQHGVVEITKSCQEVVGQLRHDCSQVSHDSQQANSAVLHARRTLHTAFLTHRSACRFADDVTIERTKSGGKSSSARVELDPWLTESRVVAAHQALHTCQTRQRATLATAYERVQAHEERRCKVLRDVVDTAMNSYRGSLGPDPNEEAALREVVGAVDCSQDLRQFTASATAAVETGRELAERQQAALDSASQDLLCSPDIIRQGQMARWLSGSGKWTDCHFILTRSGFLHWLADPSDVTPLGSLCLPKCHFEAGEAPKFNITENQGGLFSKGKRMCFEASSVEDCCEWAIAIRESIAAHKSR